MPEDKFSELKEECKNKFKQMHERGEDVEAMMWYLVFTLGYYDIVTGKQIVELFELIPLR